MLETINNKENFLNFFSYKKRVKNIRRNKIIGILFPAIKIEKKTKIKNPDKIIIKLFLFLKFTKLGIKKKRKIPNRCKYEPAICSLPKGPESLWGVFGFPKISEPEINCSIRSKETKITHKLQAIKKNLKLNNLFSVIILIAK